MTNNTTQLTEIIIFFFFFFFFLLTKSNQYGLYPSKHCSSALAGRPLALLHHNVIQGPMIGAHLLVILRSNNVQLYALSDHPSKNRKEKKKPKTNNQSLFLLTSYFNHSIETTR